MKDILTTKIGFTYLNINVNFAKGLMHNTEKYFLSFFLLCFLYLESIVERRKENMDNGRKLGALMTGLSKSFDCLHHGLLIAKLEAYSFDIK